MLNFHKAIWEFAERNKMCLVNSQSNGSDFEFVYSRTNLTITFVRDKGEFDLYFKLPSFSDRMYSLTIFSELLYDPIVDKKNELSLLNYFEANIEKIEVLLGEEFKEVDEKYDYLYRRTFW